MESHLLSKYHTHKTRQEGAGYALETLPEKTRAIFCLLVDCLCAVATNLHHTKE